MNRFIIARQIMVQLLSQKRRKRRQNIAQTHQNIMQRVVSIVFIAIIFRLPEAAAAAADVPVGCVVQEWQNWAQRIRNIVGIHLLLDLRHQLVQTTDNPNIERVR